MSKKGMSVRGLANIGTLLNRADAPAAEPVQPKGSKEAIIEKTLAKMQSFTGGDLRAIVTAAVREGFNLGHAAALDQNNEIERLINKRFDAKTQMAMPAICAAVMEHLGMTELTLVLSDVATVFDRCRIEYEASDDGAFIAYNLRHLSDDAAPDNSYSLAP